MRSGKVNLGSIALAVIIFGGIMTGLSLFYADLGGTYSVPVETFGLNQTSDVTDLSDTMINNINTGFWATDLLGWVWNAGLISLRSFTVITEVVQSIFTEVSETLGIPQWFMGTVSAAVFFILAYKITMALLNREGGT